MGRYRVLVDIIEADAARVPWLAGASATGSKRVPRRFWVAKAVLDVLQFHNELEQAEIAERGGPVGVDIEGEDEEDGVERGNRGEDETALDAQIAKVELNMTDNRVSMSRAPRGTHSPTGTAGPVRRYKKPRTTTTQAACFLLDPLAHGAPARAALAHTTYLLSSDTATESAVLPTRLQLLAVERGNAEAIHDDELFSDGELEGIVIGADEQAGEERGRRAQALQIMWGEEDAEATRVGPGVETVREGGRKIRKERVDMKKLAALLDSDDPFVALGIEEPSPGDEGGEEVGDGLGDRGMELEDRGAVEFSGNY
jgi:transcription factor IIIB subunit 2